MKKYSFLIFIITLLFSCSKSKKSIVEDNIFVPVKIEYDRGACACCGSGFLVFRQDSSISYHCDTLPGNPAISIPATVKIIFHDTIGYCTWHHIVIDEIKL